MGRLERNAPVGAGGLLQCAVFRPPLAGVNVAFVPASAAKHLQGLARIGKATRLFARGNQNGLVAQGLHADDKGRAITAQGDAGHTAGQCGGFELLKVQGVHSGPLRVRVGTGRSTMAFIAS